MSKHLSYRSGNPVLTSKAFNIQSDYTDKMTIEGTVNKTFLLLTIVMGSGYFAWTNLYASMYLVFPAFFLSIVFTFLIIFNKKYIIYFAPLYAITQGVAMGLRKDKFSRKINFIVFYIKSKTKMEKNKIWL